ncbi:hypothetical protein [Arthrobacter sp. B0490]|uniref:DUF7793 family protein n=1 Tax=Arthrobacter sp. B0490 TaxID=2058891 RepID=UPI000CE4D724|nr:hypothetical protein [Arthrobacter sp. B0490]
MTNAYTFDDRFEIVRFERCAVSVRAKKNVSVSEVDALMILRRSFEVTDHRQYVVLLVVDNITDITSGARHVLSSSRNVLAAAMLGRGAMDEVLAGPYLHAVYPGEYFTEEAAAMQWLAVMHDLVCADPVPHAMSLTVDLDPFRPRKPRAASPGPGSAFPEVRLSTSSADLERAG